MHKKSHVSAIRCAVETLEPRRLLSGGSLVPSFGGTGIVNIPETSGGLSVNATATAIQTDGKIIVVGATSDHRVAVARFNTNGMLDSTFGSGGEFLFHFSSHQDVGKAVAIQADGKIVVAGAENVGDKGPLGSPDNTSAQMAVARLTKSGALDTTFANKGIFTFGLSDFQGSTSAIATSVLVQPNGEIVFTGSVGNNQLTVPHADDDFVAMRLYSNGARDTHFGVNGITEVDMGGDGFNDYDFFDDSFASAIDTNGTAKSNPNYGKVVIVGENHTFSNLYQQFALVRLNTNGTVDDSFGGGPFLKEFRTGYKQSIGRSVVIMPNDDVVVAGQVWTGSPGDTTDFGLIAFNSKGNVDTSFGSSGTVQTDFGAHNDSAASIVIGQTGDLIVGGSSGGTLAIAAYTPNGKLDPNFGIGGKVTSSQPAIRDLAVGAGGTFVTTSNINSTTEAFYDIVPVATIASLDSSASEQGSATATFLVAQSFRVNYAHVIYLQISGSANPPSVVPNRFRPADYTLNGVVTPSLSFSSTPYVVIPANDSFVLVTLTPIDDTLVEVDETAIFSIVPNPSYNLQPVDSNNPLAAEISTTLTIHDNDGAATKAFSATADAYVRDGSYSKSKFGTANQLFVKHGASGLNRLTYLKFDLSSLTAVTSVKLQLYGTLSAASSTPIATQVFGGNDTSWKETEITYDTRPAPTGASLGTISVSGTTLNLYTLDLTAYVTKQFSAKLKVVSLLITSSVTSNPSIEFNSREANDGPQLIVS